MRVEHEGISLVPAIVVFTKYDQFRLETRFRLEDRGLDASTDTALLNTEVEKIFQEEYLAKLPVSAPAVCLQSESFVNRPAFTMLIPIPQECTSPAKSVPSFLKRLAMSSLVALLP